MGDGLSGQVFLGAAIAHSLWLVVSHELVMSKLDWYKVLNNKFIIYFLLIFAPYAYFIAYWFPFLPFHLGFSNDFLHLFYVHKAYILDYFQRLSFPLWSPSEACGYPLLASPIIQYLYPLNAPLALYCKITGGYSSIDHQIFTISGISILAVGLYKWLKSFNVRTLAALLAAIIMSLCFKTTELVRFPNAIHTFAWLPFILLGINQISIQARSMKGCINILLSIICMITASYPYYVYYAAFLLVPYTMVVTLLHLDTLKSWLRKIIYISSSAFTGLLVCSPYLYLMNDLLKQTVNRDGSNLAFSIDGSFTFLNHIGSFIFPPSSYFDGWFYFGMMPLLLVVCFLSRLKLCKQNILLFLFFAYLFIAPLFTNAAYSPLYMFFRQHLPGFSSLRAWPRFNIILVPCLAYIIANALESFEDISQQRSKLTMGQTSFIILSFSLIIACQLFLFLSQHFDKTWFGYIVLDIKYPLFLKPVVTVSFIFFNLLSFIILFVWLSRKQPANFTTRAILILVLSLADTSIIGSTQWACLSYEEKQSYELDIVAKKSITSRRTVMHCVTVLDSIYNAGLVEDWYYKAYVSFLKKQNLESLYPDQYIEFEKNIDAIKSRIVEAKSKHQDLKIKLFSKLMDYNLVKLEEAKKHRDAIFKDSAQCREIKKTLRFLGSESEKIFLTKNIGYAKPSDFLSDNDHVKKSSCASFTIVDYTGDCLNLRVEAKESVYLSFIDNDAPGWHCTVDGVPTDIKRLFGTFKSVSLSKGKHYVVFKYYLWHKRQAYASMPR